MTLAKADEACAACGAPREASSERASLRCNVRRFRDERFDVWRCAACGSIHADGEVDLARYYAGYPIFAARLDWKLHVVYGNLLRRLRAAGLSREHRVLDYGCGIGLLVEYLRLRGYADAHGYDAFAPGFDDASLLERRYDFIVCQDVIEHVDDPLGLLSRLRGMLEPGGVVSVGTPDADALDLADAEDYIHELHAPYHRHILSKRALLDAGRGVGLEVVREYDTMYNNTLFPMMSPRFALHYVRGLDDHWDLVAEPPRVSWKLLLSPATPWFALFGYFFDRHTDIQVMFRKPASRGGTDAPPPAAAQ